MVSHTPIYRGYDFKIAYIKIGTFDIHDSSANYVVNSATSLGANARPIAAFVSVNWYVAFAECSIFDYTYININVRNDTPYSEHGVNDVYATIIYI